MHYEIICLVDGERRALRVVANDAASAVASARRLEPDGFELLAVLRDEALPAAASAGAAE